ncbi:MAG TPA: PBP1A family penicillin-binding protein [Bacteroidota bacterium]|nr:PBP1A family penicillin-binding protein [Bacteroidota bacterium]
MAPSSSKPTQGSKRPSSQRMFGRLTGFVRRHTWIFILAALLAVIGSFVFIEYVVSGLPSLEQLENPKPELATKVYSIDGEVLETFYIKNRSHVAYDKFPQHLIDALISVEDKNFYDHWGVTPWRFVRAMIKNVLTLRMREGASTITQQLARNIYNLQVAHETSFDKFTRKLREFITSVQIERTYTKKEILEMYLNTIYFGRSAYGISAAASIYFDKDVSELTVGEGTLLIGMAKGPGYYDPVRHPTRAYGRRDLVLDQMVKSDKLTESEMQRIKQVPLVFHTSDVEGTAGLAPHFSEYVRRQLLEKAERYGFDIYKDGLSVYTTIDSRMQRAANRAAEEHLAERQPLFDKYWNWSKHPAALAKAIDKSARESAAFKRFDTKQQQDSVLNALRANPAFIDSVKRVWQNIEVGVVVIDPHDGGIRAMVGGRNFRSFKYGLNHATQIKRQPGSAFKPFVYTAAIDNGYPPTYEIDNQPVYLKMADGSTWAPQNFDGEVGGKYTIREGITESMNLIAVHAIMDIARPEVVVEYAHRMGIKSPIPAYESIALGTPVVTPLEMTAAYGTLANEGVYVEPISILKIEDKDGNTIEENVPERREALSKETAYLMTSMLQDVVDRGTGTRVRTYFRYPAAGKTGTTQEYADAWFMGYTPSLVAGVWVGFDDQQVSFNTSEGQGGRAAAPLWGRMMQYIYADKSIKIGRDYFQMPAGVVRETICAETKKLATPSCPQTETEVFNLKYPPGICDKHGSGVKTKTRTQF